MSQNSPKSKIANLHLRVYPLILKKPQSPPSAITIKEKIQNRRYSQNSPVPEFITEFLDEHPSSKYKATSKIHIPRHYHYPSEPSNISQKPLIQSSTICLEVPKIYYKSFKKRPVSQQITERLFIKNIVTISSLSWLLLNL